MLQTNKIILWKNSDLYMRDFDDIAKDAFSIMDVFQQFEYEWRPNYLTSYRKEETPFEWSYPNFSKELKKGVNTEGKKVFRDLGYIIGFYSSIKDEDSFGYSLKIGNTRFLNTLIVDLPININLNDIEVSNNISLMFEMLVERFSPFWGCVANSGFLSEYGYFNKVENVPETIFWLNYFSDATIKKIGKKKIDKVIKDYPNITMKNGIFKLRDVAMDFENEEDRQLHNEIHSRLLLGLQK